MLARYNLSTDAQGFSPESIGHVKRAVGFFDDFMGGISDVTKVRGDDPAQLKYPLLYEN